MGRAIGIDFGTCYSVAAYLDDAGRADVVLDRSQKSNPSLLPSVIALQEDQSVLVGWQAEELQSSRPLQTMEAIKQKLNSKSFALLGKPPVWQPADMVGLILKRLRMMSEEFLNESVSSLVLSIPSHFNETQRGVMIKAAAIAGFEKIETIADAEAICLAYQQKQTAHSLAAIYNFGGGMFEVSIVERQERNPKVRSTVGDPYLGGRNITQKIVDKIYQELNQQDGKKISRDRQLDWQIMREADKAKCAVSHRGSYDIRILDEAMGIRYVQALSRFEVADLASDIISQSLDLCRQALDKAHLAPEAIEEVILAGGSTRMPVIQEAVAGFFKREPLSKINPDHIVALGAAIASGIQR